MADGDARAAVLGRIRAALGPSPAVAEVPREYRQAGESATVDADVVDRFAERVADYRATVHRTDAAGLADIVAGLCNEGRVAVAPGLRDLAPGGVDLACDEPPLNAAALDAVDAVLTGCAVAIAETGTIVLDAGPLSGRRALTLIPDHHVCVVQAEQVVAGVPDGVAALRAAADAGRALTFVSGPSATSDIELERVEGVHGPRRLDVVLVVP